MSDGFLINLTPWAVGYSAFLIDRTFGDSGRERTDRESDGEK